MMTRLKALVTIVLLAAALGAGRHPFPARAQLLEIDVNKGVSTPRRW
jgi:hypothetical protein